MPHVCTENDVKTIFENVVKSSSQAVHVNVETVRSAHNYFNIWKDTTFQILW